MKLTPEDQKSIDIIKGTIAAKSPSVVHRDWCYIHKYHLERLLALIEKRGES